MINWPISTQLAMYIILTALKTFPIYSKYKIKYNTFYIKRRGRLEFRDYIIIFIIPSGRPSFYKNDYNILLPISVSTCITSSSTAYRRSWYRPPKIPFFRLNTLIPSTFPLRGRCSQIISILSHVVDRFSVYYYSEIDAVVRDK